APEEIIQRITDSPKNIFSLAMKRLKRDKQRWETIKPVLGFLLAARGSLSYRALRDLIAIDGDTLRDALRQLGGLVIGDKEEKEEKEKRYSLYHFMLSDFLRQNPKHPNNDHIFDTDEEEGYHQRLVVWCERGTGGIKSIWQDVQGDIGEQE